MEDIKQTPRYQQFVASLKSSPYHIKEAALLKAITGGEQWRIDAVIEAVDTNLRDWNLIDRRRIFELAAMFGQLATIQRLSENGYFNFEKKKSVLTAPYEILAAFNVAVIHGHYDVADYCRTLGANPAYAVADRWGPYAIDRAVADGDVKRMDYLFNAGAEPKYYVNRAVAGGDKKVVAYLLARGVDVNFVYDGQTPFSMAVRCGQDDIAQDLLTGGADPKLGQGAAFYAMQNNNIKMFELLLQRGATANQQVLQHAIADGKLDFAEMIINSGVSIHGRQGEPLLSAFVSKKPEEAVAFCLKHGADPKAALDHLNRDPGLYKYGSREKIMESVQKLLSKPTAPPSAPKP